MNNFGNRIKTLRLTKGLSQEELAGKIGHSGGNVGMWESGRLPRASAIPKLARVFNVEPEELAKLWMADSLEKPAKKK